MNCVQSRGFCIIAEEWERKGLTVRLILRNQLALPKFEWRLCKSYRKRDGNQENLVTKLR